ncbi:T9SS type A sorting domain-containing protein [Taibaiella soli]|uniref:T9SS type A sorting domain-containing protein n=1 Tax=Taibaiella soli TaxID=1649169 RepID=UPI001A9CEBBE|nr:T9SS type A sorting domain-containing protein [Taibaiella soli]
MAACLLLADYGANAQINLSDITPGSVTVDVSGTGTTTSSSTPVDNSATTSQVLNANGTITIDLGSAKVVQGYSLTNGGWINYPSDWTIQGSNNATSGFVTLDTHTGNTWEMDGSRKFFAANNSTAYRYYRFVNNASTQVGIYEIELFQNFSIRGTVFQDYNLNDVQDAGEPAVVGTTVWLKQLSNATPISTTVTDATGAFQFPGSAIDGQERFSVIVQPQGNLLPRSERLAYTWPKSWADGVVMFANIYPLQDANPYSQSGVVNFGLLPNTSSYVSEVTHANPNLITNEHNGTFGTSDSTGTGFMDLHPNAISFNYYDPRPDMFPNVTDYVMGSDYSYENSIASGSMLQAEATYTVTDMRGTTILETLDGGSGSQSMTQILNSTSWGWRYSVGATNGAWNDRFMALNGNAAAPISSAENIFSDTVTLVQNKNYSFGLYGKGANKTYQGAQFAVPTKLRYSLINLATGDTAAIGYMVVQTTTSNASDSINLGWNRVVTNFTATAAGNYGVYYQTYANGTAGNDAYLDNFFLRQASYQISGTVYNDANGMSNGVIDGTPMNAMAGTPVYAYLLDPSTNQVAGISNVASDGTYMLFAPDVDKSYQVVISTQVLNSGDIYGTMNTPSGWNFVGSNTGVNNTSGNNVSSAATSVTVFAVNPSSDVTNVNFGFIQGAPLPIILKDFTASKNGCAARLDWNTASEVNVKNIQIERSSNGGDFATIATVQPNGGGHYTYADDLGTGRYGYRLKVNDYDGTYFNSWVATVTLACDQHVQVYPTSTSGIVYVTGANAGAVINVYDAAGRTVITTKANSQKTTLSLSGLPSGTYFVALIDGNQLVKQTTIIKE